MAVDKELRSRWGDWQNHLWGMLLTLMPLLVAGLVAWGVISTKVNASDTRLQALETRVLIVEKDSAGVAATVAAMKSQQDKMDEKLDRLLAR